MSFIAENEIQFENFLKDDIKSGVFKLKLMKLRANREVSKIRMMVYKQKVYNNVFTLFVKAKEGRREIGVYLTDKNTIYTDNTNNFVRLKTRVSNRSELVKVEVTHYPVQQTNQDELKKPFEIKNEGNNSIASTNAINISKNAVERSSNQKNSELTNDKSKLISELLNTDLQSAKKVWAILKNGDELQVENNLYEDSKVIFLGSSKTNVDISLIKSIKFRGKVYLG
jgi:hypothetical protein